MTYDWVGKWIDRRQLDAEALSDERAAYASRPGRWVVLERFLPDRLAQVLSRFLTREVEFTTGFGLKERYGFVSEAEFNDAPEGERLFRFGGLDRVQGKAARSPGFRAYSALTGAFSDPRIREVFETLCGTALGEATLSARRMAPGDFLDSHTDDVEDRQLSWVIYLTPGWKRAHGGLLQLDEGGGRISEVVPAYNSVAIFDASTWHRVTPPTASAKARLTFGGWYRRAGA